MGKLSLQPYSVSAPRSLSPSIDIITIDFLDYAKTTLLGARLPVSVDIFQMSQYHSNVLPIYVSFIRMSKDPKIISPTCASRN